MIDALGNLDKRTAAGILTRAALYLENGGNPDARVLVAGEKDLRTAVFRELRHKLEVAPDDNSPGTLERLGDLLDEESEQLLEPVDTQAALQRLAERGDLPSDVYEFRVIPNIENWFKADYVLEYDLIKATIREPLREQHFGRSDARQPSLVSLFYRNFSTPFQQRNFGMLVVAERDGMVLVVHQAWRIYPWAVNPVGIKDLVEMLHRFADVYGVDIAVGGKKGHFFLTADEPAPNSFTLPFDSRSMPVEAAISQFVRPGAAGRTVACLITSIDLNRYRAAINKYPVKKSDIFELNVRRPETRADQ